jgi:cell division protein FtsW
MIPADQLEDDDRHPAAPAPVLETQEPQLAERERGIDVLLLFAILALLCIGTVEIYSASAVKAGSATFLVKHLGYLAVGGALMWWVSRLDYAWLRRFMLPLLLGSLGLLAAVLVLGARIGVARRWFILGPLSFQPVEIAKLALVAYLATSLARKQERVRTFSGGFLPHLAVCGLMMGLLLKQPDLGSALILAASTMVLLFVAGTKLSYIVIAVLAATPVLYHQIVGTPWRLRRLVAFLDPWQFREGVGYQITESLISIGSGGLTGVGLGQGKQKLFYMPEAHTDFIMSNVGEELGFVGFAAVLALFVVIVWRGVRAALSARDAFGTYLAWGITSIFALQALVNTAVVLGAIPAKGLTLPFVSYGGTSLIMSMVSAGVLLNISRRAPAEAPRSAEIRNALPANRRRQRQMRVRVVVG